MCLDYLDNTIELQREGNHYVGWKKFSNNYGHPCLRFFCGRRVPVGKWIHEKDYRELPLQKHILASSGESYPTGFHIYIKDPRIGCRKVYFRQTVAKGHQYSSPVVVAKEIFIPYFRDYK